MTSFLKGIRKEGILFSIVLFKFILQYLLINPAYELQRDEYLHLDQGRHLAWGYISVPPVTSWLSFLIQLLGNGVFWVKFFPALFGALTVVLVWKTIETLGGGLYGMVLGAIAVTVSVVLRINILFQPNSLDIFFWTAVYFALIKFIKAGENKWLYAAGLSFAFGFLSKYNVVILLASLAPAFLLTPQRNIYRNKHLYFSAAIAFVIILPNLLWQYENHFPTAKQLRELAQTQLVHVNRIDFVKEQFLFFSSSFFIIICGFVGFFRHAPFKKYRFVFWTYVIALALFVYFKAKAYYAIGLYPVLLAFGAVYLERLLAKGFWIYARSVVLLLVLASALPFILIAFPLQSPEAVQKNLGRYKSLGLLRWEDGKDHNLPQDFADMIGWKEIAALADKAYSEAGDTAHTFVLCDNYGEAGAVNYYSSHKDINAVSFNADYRNWMRLEQPIKNVVLVTDADDDDTARKVERPLFDSVRFIGANSNPYSREKGTRVYLLKGARADINARIRRERDGLKP